MKTSRWMGSLAVALVIVQLASCSLTPPSKYDAEQGLDVTGTGTGASPVELEGTPKALRASRMAATLAALAHWCEEFADLKRDVDASEDEIPLELYDPDNPPPLLDNLVPYKEDFAIAAEKLSFVFESGSKGGGDAGVRGFVAWCDLRPGVLFRWENTWDEFDVEVKSGGVLEINSQSGYFRPMLLGVAGGRLIIEDEAVEAGEEVLLPVEYVEGLLAGHDIRVQTRTRPDGRVDATLTRHFSPPPRSRR